jgi:hypothetical protein
MPRALIQTKPVLESTRGTKTVQTMSITTAHASAPVHLFSIGVPNVLFSVSEFLREVVTFRVPVERRDSVHPETAARMFRLGARPHQDEPTVLCAAEERLVLQHCEDGVAQETVQAEQALRLPRRQPETWHLHELAADPTQQVGRRAV